MKPFFTLSLLLISSLSFSQEVVLEDLEIAPVSPVIKTLNYEGFDGIYDRLKSMSQNINETSDVVFNFKDMRRGWLVVDTRNIGKSFEGMSFDPRPSLDLELERVMFSGNFFNPNDPGIPCRIIGN